MQKEFLLVAEKMCLVTERDLLIVSKRHLWVSSGSLLNRRTGYSEVKRCPYKLKGIYPMEV